MRIFGFFIFLKGFRRDLEIFRDFKFINVYLRMWERG